MNRSNKPFPKLRNKNKNGRYNWGTLIFSSIGIYGDKILVGYFSTKKEDIKQQVYGYNKLQ